MPREYGDDDDEQRMTLALIDSETEGAINGRSIAPIAHPLR
jgi:hypothetical protein